MNFLKVNIFTLILFSIPSLSIGQTNKPNIIYIMTDDLGYADLSSYGRKEYQTPNLDKLASQGIKFMNAYAAAPVCTPTRVALMTGRYPARTKVGLHEPLEWSARDSTIGLTPEDPSIATLLKQAGYKSYLVGKWHLGFAPEFNPVKNGFDYFYGFHGGGIDYTSHTGPRVTTPALYENYTPLKKEGYFTDVLAEKAIEVINDTHSKPFFLAIMFNAPHWPWQAPGDKSYPDTMLWTAGGSPAVYAAMMKSLDDAVGSIVKTLDEKGLANKTIVIFTSDNGGERFSNMGIYKGRKMSLWEGGIRVPAFVRWQGKIKPNTTTNQVVTTMDWTATILSAAGARANPKFPLDGIDLMPVMTAKNKEVDRTLYWRISQRRDHQALRSANWKYLRDEKGMEYLFDLSTDAEEKNDLKTKQIEIFNSLKAKYKIWEAGMLQPLPLQQPK